MHSHKPYWSAVFHFCRAFKDFLPDSSAPHAAPHRLESRMLPPQGRCRPPLSLLSSLPLNPNTSEGKAVSNNVETASREFLDTANAFYLPCAQQAGCIEKPKYFEKNLSGFNKGHQLGVQQFANVFTNLGACFSSLNKWQWTGLKRIYCHWESDPLYCPLF